MQRNGAKVAVQQACTPRARLLAEKEALLCSSEWGYRTHNSGDTQLAGGEAMAGAGEAARPEPSEGTGAEGANDR